MQLSDSSGYEPGGSENETAPMEPRSAVPRAGRPPAQPTMDNPPDMLGPYQVESALGRGGMGMVYRGWDPHLERPVAIKMISDKYFQDEDSLERLKVEARAAARLSHPNIVSVYAMAEDAGRPYIAMELAEGQTLEAELRDKGPLKAAEATTLMRQAAEALAYATSNHIVHRDIKPSNLIITSGGALKILDFGMAKRLDNDMSLTATGHVVGTPRYMAPEQAKGEKVDFRADMYALGLTFFTALTNQFPFDGSTPYSVILKQVNDDLEIPGEWQRLGDGRLVRILKRLTAKKPDSRYASWDEVVKELRDLESRLTAPTVPLPVPREPHRFGWLVWAGIAIAAAVLLGLGGWLLADLLGANGDGPPPAETPTARQEAFAGSPGTPSSRNSSKASGSS